MKTFTKLVIILTGFFVYLFMPAQAQERPAFVTATTVHWNMHLEDFSMDEWKAMEKEYFDKVTMKNEYIVHSNVLMHYFTADNSELVFVTSYPSWEAIQQAQQRSDELEKAAWPDQSEREAFLDKRNHYYSTKHSDEIYSTLPNAKLLSEKPEKPMVYYVRVSHRAFPEDGSSEEMRALETEFVENVFMKNSYIKAYFPNRHAWGSDGRDYLEAFVVESLSDLEKALSENEKLIQQHWPDEESRKAYFDKVDKYFTPWHGDFIYRHIPELMK